MWLDSALKPSPCSVPGFSLVEQPISIASRWQTATRSHWNLKDLLISNNPVATAERDCAPCWAHRPMSRSKPWLRVEVPSALDKIHAKQTDFSPPSSRFDQDYMIYFTFPKADLPRLDHLTKAVGVTELTPTDAHVQKLRQGEDKDFF